MKTTGLDPNDIPFQLTKLMRCHRARTPSLPHSHVSKGSGESNKRQTFLLETELKRNKSPRKEHWRKEDKKVEINHAHLSSHWRFQYVTRLWEGGVRHNPERSSLPTRWLHHHRRPPVSTRLFLIA
jgi:hypothetical protein